MNKMINKNFLTILLSFTINVFTFAQQDSVLAKVGSDKIFVKEFVERFQSVPQLDKNRPSLFEKEKNFLLTLIAEKLFALEASELKYDSSDVIKYSFNALKKMYLRDALYRSIIQNQPVVTEEEMREQTEKYFTRFLLDFLFFDDSSSALMSYNKLINGEKFDSLKSKLSINMPAIEVGYNDFEPEVGQKIFQLKTNAFSEPIKSKGGWLIFKLLSKSVQSFTSKDLNSTLKKIKSEIIQKKNDERIINFYKDFFHNKKVVTDATLFNSFVIKVFNILNERKKANNLSDTAKVYLVAQDIYKIEKDFGNDSLYLPFILFDKNPVSLKQFIREFIFDGFYTDNIDRHILAAKINSRIKTFIENELLAREAFRLGMENLPDVQLNIKMWKDYYLSELIKKKIIDSVKADEIEVSDYLNSKNDSAYLTEINILEILTDSLSTVQKVLSELEQGKDFGSLAEKYTKRKWAKEKGGEFGFFPPSMYPEIGSIAVNLNLGEVYGPLKTKDGYSIFKLIDRREKKITEPDSSSVNKEQIEYKLLTAKITKALIDHTIKMADKYGVEINKDLLERLEVKDLKMLVFRYMGFGGQITAVPLSTPFSQWFYFWNKHNLILP